MGEKVTAFSYTYFLSRKEYRMKNAVTKQDYDNQSVERQAKLMVRGLSGGFEVE